jgi:hypothetical protein
MNGLWSCLTAMKYLPFEFRAYCVLFTTLLLWRFFFLMCAQCRPGFRSASCSLVALFFPSQGFLFLRQSMVVAVLFLFFLPPLGLCQDPEICFPACLICAQQRICYSLVGDEDSFFIPGFASFSLTVCSIWSGLCAPPVRAVCGSRVFNLLDWVCNWLSARDCRQLLDLTEYIFFWLDFLVLSLLIDFANHETWIEK